MPFNRKGPNLPMQFAEAAEIVKEIPPPRTHPIRGRVLYRHIRQTQPKKLLELGTARGGSAVYIAAALEANGAGHLTTVDRRTGFLTGPSAAEVLQQAGLSSLVTLDKRFSTYTWYLKSEVERRLTPAGTVRPCYDFIFIDGAKNWSTDGLAVVLAEKLLRPGGWLLLDDLGWKYGAGSRAKRHYGTEIAKLSDEERDQPHLRAVFDLLIKTNPAFDKFVIQDEWWGWARKSPDPARCARGGPLRGEPNDPGSRRPATGTLRRRVSRHTPQAVRRRIRSLQRIAGRS